MRCHDSRFQPHPIFHRSTASPRPARRFRIRGISMPRLITRGAAIEHVGTIKFDFFPFTCGYMEKIYDINRDRWR